MMSNDEPPKLSELLSSTNPTMLSDPIKRPTELIEAVELIHSTYSGGMEDLDEIDLYKTGVFIAECHENNNWDSVKTRDVVTAARAVFTGKTSTYERFSNLREFFIAETGTSKDAVFLGAIFEIYLESFDPSSNITTQLAAALKKNTAQMSDFRRHLISRNPEIFDLDNGVSEITTKLLTSKSPYNDLINQGFNEVQGKGFFDFVFKYFVNSTSSKLAIPDPKSVKQLFELMNPEDGVKRTLNAHVGIDALLNPWIDEPPPEAYKQELTAWILNTYGDPRVDKIGVWVDVKESSKTTLFRWLVGDTLNAFFQVITKAENQKDYSMWEKRVGFWKDLHKEEKILEAWPAYSREARGIARTLFKNTGDSAFSYFGHQNTRPKTCLLIMKIGNSTVVKGSHSYKVQINPNHIFMALETMTASSSGNNLTGVKCILLLGAG